MLQNYIGMKIVKAEPVVKDGKSGYKVVYPGGYESWSPADVFEKAYMEIDGNPQLPSKISISQKMVDDFILETWTTTLGEKTTVVRALLKNGFEIVESSACVDPENYSETIGKEICLEKIKDKIWDYLGFLLQTAIQGVK